MINKQDQRLTAFVLGELSPAESAKVQNEIDASPELQATVDEIRETVEMLKDQFVSGNDAKLLPEQRAAIVNSAQAAKGYSAASNSINASSQSPILNWILAAGIATVLASLVYFLAQGPGYIDNIASGDAVLETPGFSQSTQKRNPGSRDSLSQLSLVDESESTHDQTVDMPNSTATIKNDFRREVQRRQRFLQLNQDRYGLRTEEEKKSFTDFGINGRYEEDDIRFDYLDTTRYRHLPMDARERSGKFDFAVPNYLGDSEPLFDGEGRFAEGDFAVGPEGLKLETYFKSITGRDATEEQSGSEGSQSGSDGSEQSGLDGSEQLGRALTGNETNELIVNLLRRVDPSGTRDVEIAKTDEGLFLSIKDEPENRIKLFSKSAQSDSLDLSSLGESIAPRGFEKDFTNFLETRLKVRNEALAARKSWKRVDAVANTSRLMVGDKDELDMEGMQVNVQVDGFRARVLIDAFYYNDRARQLEGNFKLRLPDDASLYYFAFGQSSFDFAAQGQLSESEFIQPADDTKFVSLAADRIADQREKAWDNVKEARMVPREKAAFAYQQTVQRKVDPALVEWSGAGVFSARVFPLMPQKLHRIVIGYDVNLTSSDEGLTYRLDLPQELGQCRVNVNVKQTEDTFYSISPEVKPQVADGNRRFTFANSKLGDERSIKLTARGGGPVLLQSQDEDEGDFWTAQMTPDLPEEVATANPRAVFLLDTSLSSNPDKFNTWLMLLEETLTQNRESLKEFAVLNFNVESYFWKDKFVENTADNVEQLIAHCNELALEGATDLYGAVDLLTTTKWIAEGTHGPDLFLLSDGATTWGETNLRLIQDRIATANLGSLFAYQTGLTGTAIAGLRFLADRSGGAVFSVATESEIETAATAHRKRPWLIESMVVEGASDVMSAGRVSWIYPGQTITLVGRGNAEGSAKLVLSQGLTEKIVTTKFAEKMESDLASRMYGYVAVGQLESLGASIEDVSAAYARHFRVTGETCSLLMLETEEDYTRFNIAPQEDLFVIKTKDATSLVAKTLSEDAAELVSPKSRMMSWLNKLQQMPGFEFKIPTALSLALDEIQVPAISQPMKCATRTRAELSEEFLAHLHSGDLDYETVLKEAKRRGVGAASDSIKVLSSLVEQNPGDLTLARDIAFVAMELDRPAQAYGLLRRVATMRPFEPTIYPAMAKCLAQLGQADMAIVYYEIATTAKFQNQNQDFSKIVALEYRHLLRQVSDGLIACNVVDYAKARLNSLEKNVEDEGHDIVITMMWNTDQSDVDLHVIEPSGEDCHYGLPQTKSGGLMTSDVTTGFGPEMYTISKAPAGKFEVKVKYFGSQASRTSMRNKVYLTIYRNFGRENEKVTYKSVELNSVGDIQPVATVGIE